MGKKLFTLTVLCLVCGLPASPVYSAMPSFTGANVSGDGTHTTPGGILATTSDVGLAAQYTITCIDTAILEATSSIVTALKGQTEAMKIMSQGQVEALRQLMLQQSVSELETELKRKSSPSAQAGNSCEARDGAAAYGVGRKAEGGLRADLNQQNTLLTDGKMKAPVDISMANQAKVAEMEKQEPVGDWMFPASGLIPDDALKKAHELARESVNPHPTAKLDEALQATPAGQDALYRQQVKKARLAVADDTMNAVIAAHSPLLDAGAILEALQRDMGDDAVDVPKNAQGRTSVMSYLDAWSRARFGNANWHQNMTQTTAEMKLLREMVYMMAMQIEMDRRSLDMQMRTAGLLASIQSILVEQMHNPVVQYTLDPSRVGGRAAQ